MRSTDFTRTPAPGQAGALFVGLTHYTGLWTLITLAPRWRRLLREMKRHRGYVWHKLYWRTPLQIGTMAFFTDADALNKFARGRAHHDLMCWLTDDGTRRARAGFVRIYTASPHGYTNGAWRAEDGSLGHIDTFAPLSTERAPKPVRHRTGR
ncbi:hypothetical protein SRB5_27790 [Streptomyces sp. RB5]|uniref:DUF4188 domain-containing protein n=1 Tax=Streptomyces smaragdinus TaxID=2585196 RepID=A0A7K0CGZ2_9ACTN|nr:DUF4188 domain-containing protein [Streptomyces smaragdinus]MQY12643.1 hypothetical protein [Streptomyces smaragdinus]